jgi:hypothetical protein
VEELEHRSTPRAKQRLKEVKGVLAGERHPPKPPLSSRCTGESARHVRRMTSSGGKFPGPAPHAA